MRARTLIRRTIWGLIISATVIALFYAEEDWRGARALRLAEQDYTNAGHSLDFAHFVPPPIPDAENLAALPIFALMPDPLNRYLEAATLMRALQTPSVDQIEPSNGNWQRGELPDLPALRAYAAAAYQAEFKSAPPPSSSAWAQLEAVYPLVPMLRGEMESHPRCRFDCDYKNPWKIGRSLTLIVDQINLTKLITLDAMLALNGNQPHIAFRDLRTILQLESGARRDPSTEAGFVSIGMGAISEAIVADGLALHRWNDEELAELQGNLARVDYLSTYRFSVQGELAAQMADLPVSRAYLTGGAFRHHLAEDAEDHKVLDIGFLPWPAGWVDGGMARVIRYSMENLQVIDPRARRVYPDRSSSLAEKRDDALLFHHFILPWNFVFVERTMMTNDTLAWKFARAQAWVDHSVIACALERYRLAHGGYPAALSALEPEYLTSVPDDFMIGEPYHYRVQPDGSYLLYSVGWNQKDDGGTVVLKKERPEFHQIDYEQGDWVWFGPK